MATMLQLGNNSILFLIIFSICLSIINAQDATTVAAVEESETIWSSCQEDFKSPIAAKDVKVFVNQCPPVNGSETRCKLTKGIDAVLKIQFKTIAKVPSIERIIVARVPVAGRMVEMPYGPSISPCENSSTIADDGSECVDNGVVADKNYTFTSLFKVLKSFPTVENISVRIIVRQKLDDHKKLRLYRKHPGPMLFCILVPNIETTD
ncbi:uncharacterized protein LOC113791845 [Dermatophagoides pteronyssinus]|uniref:Uncharacterized protein n=1 Tax=Dermatophagoides pteronyssinus TaxID=6956 RepID=A0ABQ8IWN9_DERPT|nr:hypothetical protein DERP_008554 [Dermatophagoides pteronyssinus]